MNDPNITRTISQRIVQHQPELRIKDMEAWLLHNADKTDPFNLRAVLAVQAVIDGKCAAWVVETGNRGEVLSRLVEGAVDAIIAKPDQDRATAADNRHFVD